VAHDRVPGRLRLRLPALRKRPALGPILVAALRERPGLRDAQANGVTGSLLVTFDPRGVAAAQVVAWVEEALAGRSHARALVTLPPASEPEEGLTAVEVERQRGWTGRNILPEIAPRSAWGIARDQLVSLPNLMLVGAAGLSLATGGVLDAAVIAAVLVLNGSIGFGTERYAERAVRSLQRLGAPRARVIRDGRVVQIPAEEVVVGDQVLLRAGDRVPADGRAIEAFGLTVDEATLTGESVPVAKEPEHDADVLMGATVVSGRGRALVTAIGPATRMGRIAALVRSEAAPRTPLQRGLDAMARTLGGVVLATCAGLCGAGILLGRPLWGMVETTVALAISAVPEGLPAVATTALAAGMARMLGHRVAIRTLAAVEALGSVTVLCVDKTGTLTQNRMRVAAFAADGEPASPLASPTVRRLLEVGALCSEAEPNGRGFHGSATETALLAAASAAGIEVASLRRAYPLLDVRHRANGNPLMATSHVAPGSRRRLCVKGAPEVVLDACATLQMADNRLPLTGTLRQQILADAEAMAARGLRVLGFAEAWTPVRRLRDDSVGDVALVWLGLAGMEDPVRPEVGAAIARCREAGIRPVILTGDHPVTAAAVAQRLEIAESDVYARVTPEEKLRIVRDLQAKGEVVAMTGDGVNDGPALKAADVGVAMGERGTETAREIADIVLLRDDFEALVAAVEQGRAIRRNIGRALRFLLASNLAEVISVGASLLLRAPIPMTAVQMLWMNLISDVFPAVALALEPPRANELTQPPRAPGAPLLSRSDWRAVTRDSAALAAGTLGVYHLAARRLGPGLQAQTAAFSASCLAEIIYALTCGSPLVRRGGSTRPDGPLLGVVAGTAALQAGTLLSPPLRRLLHLAPLGRGGWQILLAGAVLPAALSAAARATAGRRLLEDPFGNLHQSPGS
jgi:Ca2+-transporting ATPase